MKVKIILASCLVLAAAAAGYFGYRYSKLSKENAGQAAQISDLQSKLDAANADAANLQITLASTTNSLQMEQQINAGFTSQISSLSGTVGQLQKVISTDPHLLEKYSKVYFLSENYAPSSLSPIDSQYLFDKSRSELVLTGVLPYLEGLLASAQRAGVQLQIISAYRSFYEQEALKLDYKITYGSGANQFSADQGYSEHQLGTTVDFGVPNGSNLVPKFASTTAYQWLTANAYQYGFIISYPQGNTFYQFEPWHWRFVGIALATHLHDNNEYFYNLSQDQINQYLGSFFN